MRTTPESLTAIAVGRVTRGVIRPNQQITVVKYDGEQHRAKVGLVYGYHGLERHEVAEASAGDIVAITGIEAPDGIRFDGQPLPGVLLGRSQASRA